MARQRRRAHEEFWSGTNGTELFIQERLAAVIETNYTDRSVAAYRMMEKSRNPQNRIQLGTFYGARGNYIVSYYA
jgi:hypothetical protein